MFYRTSKLIKHRCVKLNNGTIAGFIKWTEKIVVLLTGVWATNEGSQGPFVYYKSPSESMESESDYSQERIYYALTMVIKVE